MVCWWWWLSDERNSEDRNWMRLQNPENRNMGVTTWTYWAFVWQQFCPSGASTLPMMGKQRAPVGQAACPIWYKSVIKNKRALFETFHDTSVILLWYISVKQMEKSHSGNWLHVRRLCLSEGSKMILWYFSWEKSFIPQVQHRTAIPSTGVA